MIAASDIGIVLSRQDTIDLYRALSVLKNKIGGKKFGDILLGNVPTDHNYTYLSIVMRISEVGEMFVDEKCND